MYGFGMIKKLISQVVESITITTTSSAVDREEAIRLATAVLMIDVARADHVFGLGSRVP